MLTAAVNLLQTVGIDAVSIAVRANSVAELCQPKPCMHAHMPHAAFILAHWGTAAQVRNNTTLRQYAHTVTNLATQVWLQLFVLGFVYS